MQDFLLGCNFWDSKSGTDMWLNFDEESLRADINALADNGIRVLRCFPNWREFQPVIALRKWRGNFGEYRLTGDRIPENEYFIEPVMIERFKKFAELANERGIQLVVSILTGWMSGRLFMPPVLDSKNLISDPEALMFEEKFVRGFVKYTRDIENIVMWDLGNECNCLGHAPSRAASYMWTATIRNAILASDNTRPISSGMHALEFEPDAVWSIADQGLLTDVLTPHPYPSPTIGGDIDPADRPRTTMLPTVQCEYYSGLSGKPAMIQEQGTFSDMIINREGAGDFLRVNICSSIANGGIGYFWWLSHEHLHLDRPPYTWSMIERELGILDPDRNPKPVARELKRMGEIMDKLPEIPAKECDSVIVLSREQQQWQIGATSYILAKRAGLTPMIRSCYGELPKAKLYFLPCLRGWASLYKEAYVTLIDRVYNDGASLFITIDTGLICEFEKVTGVRSYGMSNAGGDRMSFDGIDFPIEYAKKFELEPLTAEVLARDSSGNPVFTKNKLGKGYVYFMPCKLELTLWNRAGSFLENAPDYSKLYAAAAGEIFAEKPMRCLDPDVSLTLHPDGEGYIAIAVNYTNKDKDSLVKLAEGWKLDPIYGDFACVEKCTMAVGRLVRA